jgi:hypothetical protein
MARWLSMSVFAVLLVGCGTGGGLQGLPGITDRLLPAGARLVVERPVPIAAGRARVFFQGGGLAGGTGIGSGSFDPYRPHCALEIDSVDHEGFEIRPGSFAIVRVQRSLESVVHNGSVQVAALLSFGPWLSDRDRYHDGYHLWLDSAEQPGVRRLTCYGVFAEWPDLRPPTLAEMQAALGDFATIRGPMPGEFDRG